MSNWASTTAPTAFLFGLDFNSKISASNNTFSNNSGIPSPVFAEISCDWILPPHSSMSKFMEDNWVFTLSGLALGLSILLIAKMIGTPAACAWDIASFVWGITSSSAAATIITKSVTWAPRARMAVKASCPGVSRNAIFWSPTLTEYAPMCWVIPPDSPSITFAFLM